MMRQRRVVDNREEIPDMYDVHERIVFLCNLSSFFTKYPFFTRDTGWETIITKVQKDVAIKLLLQDI